MKDPRENGAPLTEGEYRWKVVKNFLRIPVMFASPMNVT